MQHKETISLSKATIKAIESDSENKIELLTESILNESDTIVSLLNNYDYFNDTHGEISDFEIQEGSMYINNDGRGGFRVEYKVYYYFGCDNLNRDYDQEMELKIEANLKTNEAVIIGESWKEREPDEF